VAEYIWLNGQILPMGEARIGVEDRGFQFADGVYEVIRFYGGKCFTLDEHMERLDKSAAALRIPLPLPMPELKSAIKDLVRRNGELEGMVYLQLTRGEAHRSHPFPKHPRPTLLFYTRPLPPVWQPGEGQGVKILSIPDERWNRCWVKSLALLPNILAKQEAIEANCDEAVFILDGVVTECSSTNIFFVKGSKLHTHPAGSRVLPGITRQVLSRICRDLGVELVEKGMPADEARLADEIFVTSTTRELNWVRQWDGKTVAGGKCGKLTHTLHAAYRKMVLSQTAQAARPAHETAQPVVG
jgi:D-alanine transaminase